MLWDAVVAPEMTFRLVPEVLDAVDVVAVLGKELGVIDTATGWSRPGRSVA